MTKARDLANFVSTGSPLADGTLSVADISDLTASAAEINVLDGVTASTAELNILDGVTATASELNILDGVTASTAELNILDGVTATASEINLLDGSVAATVANSKAVIYGASGEIVATQVDITATGDLRLQDTTGGEYVALQAPGTVSASYTLTLPAADGTSGQFIQTNGSGALSFATVASGPWALIDTKVANNAVNLDFTGLSGYNTYMAILSAWGSESAGNSVSVAMRIGEGSTTFMTSSYEGSGYKTSSTTPFWARIGNSSEMYLHGTTFSPTISGIYIITNCTNSKNTTMVGISAFSPTLDAEGGLSFGTYAGSTNDTTALRFFLTASKNNDQGSISLYGLEE